MKDTLRAGDARCWASFRIRKHLRPYGRARPLYVENGRGPRRPRLARPVRRRIHFPRSSMRSERLTSGIGFLSAVATLVC
jgi:hypothetical protein